MTVKKYVLKRLERANDLVMDFFLRKNVISKANLFIIGAQKCGTSTLYDNLIVHRNIFGGDHKEKNFFSDEKLFQRGEDWYHTLFPKGSLFYKANKSYFIDASPSYLPSKEVANRIHKYNPDAKFIVMMRNPIDRAFSGWNMYSQMHLRVPKKRNINGVAAEREKSFIDFIYQEKFPTFEELIQQEMANFSVDSAVDFPGVLARGVYYNQIEYYFSLFDKNQFFFICAEEFKVNKNQILMELMNFIELEDGFLKEELADTHIREYKHQMSEETRMKLVEFYAPFNEKLFALINKRYDWNK